MVLQQKYVGLRPREGGEGVREDVDWTPKVFELFFVKVMNDYIFPIGAHLLCEILDRFACVFMQTKVRNSPAHSLHLPHQVIEFTRVFPFKLKKRLLLKSKK